MNHTTSSHSRYKDAQCTQNTLLFCSKNNHLHMLNNNWYRLWYKSNIRLIHMSECTGLKLRRVLCGMKNMLCDALGSLLWGWTLHRPFLLSYSFGLQYIRCMLCFPTCMIRKMVSKCSLLCMCHLVAEWNCLRMSRMRLINCSMCNWPLNNC